MAACVVGDIDRSDSRIEQIEADRFERLRSEESSYSGGDPWRIPSSGVSARSKPVIRLQCCVHSALRAGNTATVAVGAFDQHPATTGAGCPNAQSRRPACCNHADLATECEVFRPAARAGVERGVDHGVSVNASSCRRLRFRLRPPCEFIIAEHRIDDLPTPLPTIFTLPIAASAATPTTPAVSDLPAGAWRR